MIKKRPVVTSHDISDEDEEDSTDCESVIENAHQQVPQMSVYPPKLGELYSHLYLAVAKKVLRTIIKKRKTTE